MQAWAFWRQSTRHFRQHWGSYVSLVFLTNIIISYCAIPVFSWLTATLLRWQHIPYVSYTNLGSIVFKHPVAIIGLLAILLAIMVLVYWQFAFLLLGIRNIRLGRPRTTRELLRTTVTSLADASPSTFLFFIGYFLIIMPFGSILFSTPLLNKAKIPSFITTYLMANPIWATVLILFYAAAIYLGIRLIAVLPLMMLDQYHSRAAIRESWRTTRFNFWRYVSRMLVTLAMVTLFVAIAYAAIYLGQLYFDTTKIALAAATTNLFLMEVLTEFIVCYATILFMSIILSSHADHEPTPMMLLSFHEPARTKRRTRVLIITGLVIISALLVTFNLVYLNGLAISKPLTIAHRGVDNGNGVQNTIPALVKTSREKPDYVEMDIQQTKDHQFVVMHDTNLKALAGINRRVGSLTLKQLTKITVTENGYQAKIPSFNTYLKAAIAHHQKLLVEIKTNSATTPDVAQRFTRQFGSTLLAHHEQVHTLSYKIMTALRREDPRQFVSYILPYNLTFPYTTANAYTMEATTLNDSFIDQADKHHQKVYAWDIDNVTQLDQMMFLGVNGIITDNLHEMQVEIRNNTDHPSYANLLLAFMNELSLETQTQ
ncbi:glycerophosphoryl diester phosphodiesterase membrane domain-containing protein [Levilactobacillus acidifarinae]|uniref:Glycerophosphoryl diester phosphodiesterase n=1 Tax=Levilactobacillus acidifarinae DSM 19394 = JCM 15949 TaxID=1423715 RepID=A0A0R1LEJ7_9LACO|nr:glycerophosphodiester phosphodiesterase [Levilactobacillus acidifarinae]KRK94140.1 glycerophosphoryl diester phosphodiesterase [Levilactobacillus acidifarinae DSM 19394]GEO70600.1 glycerophosphoryl diester phosphodiesterase [Levilactobacillus acidifarinae]